MNSAAEVPCTHSRRWWWRRLCGVCVSTCFEDHPTLHQFQNGRHVLRMALFKSLPRMIGAFGSDRRRQPVDIDDKMTPPVLNSFFRGFEGCQGIDGFIHGEPVPLIRLCHDLHQSGRHNQVINVQRARRYNGPFEG